MTSTFIKIIELHFSNRCTGDCVVCSKAHGFNSPQFVTSSIVDATIRNLHNVDFNTLQLGGDGDSFLNPVFIPSLRKYRENFPGKSMCLFSNASMLTVDNADTIIEEHLLDDLQTRIDSMNPVLYKQSTKLSLENVLDNIIYFFQHNDCVRYHIIYFPLYAYKEMCLRRLGKMPAHWDRIDETLLKDESASVRRFFYLIPRNEKMHEALLNFRVSPICLWGEREDMKPVASSVCTQLPESNGCFKNQIYIYPNGNIGMCAYDDGQNTFVVGNVLDSDYAVRDTWNGALRKQIIDDVRAGKYYGKYPCTNPIACGMHFVDKSFKRS